MRSSFLIGSNPTVPLSTFSIVANAVTETTATIPAGPYYLYDPTSTLSLLTALATALTSHAEITLAAAFIGRDRRVHVASDIAFTCAWTGDTTSRSMLGFAGNMSTPATSFTADSVSDYLWSPGRNEISSARLGEQGLRRYDTAVGTSGPGNVVATRNNVVVHNDFSWRSVDISRTWTSAESGGEWQTFFDVVISRFSRFKLYRDLDDIAGDDTALTMVNPLGPYKMRHDGGLVQYDHVRTIPMVETLCDVSLAVIVTSEYA